VILDVNGAEPADLADLRFLLAELQWGQRAGLLVRRGEDELEIAALLFPRVDTSEAGAAPGYEVQPLLPVAPRSPVPVAEHVAPADAPVWALVSRDGSPVRAEVRLDDVLTEVHELDGVGRVVRSHYREPLEDGAVEVRYERDGSGAVIGEVRVDRTGRPVG
jgi:hypothetical protein